MKRTSKLRLRGEVVRRLSGIELGAAIGGALKSFAGSCAPGCNSDLCPQETAGYCPTIENPSCNTQAQGCDTGGSIIA